MTPARRSTNDEEAPEQEEATMGTTSVKKGVPLEHTTSSNGLSVDDTFDSQSQADKEEHPSSRKRRRHRRWIVVGGALLLVVVCFAVGLGLGLGLPRSGGRTTEESPGASADTETDTPSSTTDDSATSTVKETFDKCTMDSVLNQDSYNECEQQCEEASCCDAQECNDSSTCLNYSRCELLAKAGGSVPRAPSNLQELCNIDAMGEDALESCMNACKPAACCEAEGADNCFHQGNAFVCAEYDICKPVHALSSGGLGEPPENLAEVCNANALSTVDGYSQCGIMCQPAQCCNSLGGDNCLLENILACGQWNIGGCYLLER